MTPAKDTSSFNSSSNVSTWEPSKPYSFFHPDFPRCSKNLPSSVIFASFTCTSFLLLLPLSGYVLYVGARRWLERRQRASSARTPSEQSDFLTYNSTLMEPIGLFGCAYYSFGIFSQSNNQMSVGVYILFIIYLGRLLFQCLTCVEQYLAVIHPVTFLLLKTRRGLMVRNAGIASVWAMCLSLVVFVGRYRPYLSTIPFFSMFASGQVVITFCSFSVLCQLLRRGPAGRAGGDRRGRLDRSKMKAFRTIMIITGVILLKYSGLLISIGVHANMDDYRDGCVVLMSGFWFCLPSSVSLPLLFLHRAGKLPWCRRVNVSG